MQNPAAEQSEWTEDDLGDYGYIYGVDAEDDVQSFRNHITPLYGKGDGALGLGTTNEVSQMYAQLLLWEDEDGNEVVPSLGFFKNIVNGPEGYIIAGSNTSPESSDVRVVPALSKWSDIVAIQWTSFAGQNPAPLGLVIQSSVRNANTLAIIQRAFITIGQATVPLWPGIDFERTDRSTPQQAQAFTGLLGSYHGAGPAYMLAQHQMLFGQRMITRIRIWAETTPWDVATGSIVDFEANMVLFVDDVPA
ncbi:hypothetical protein F5884DRAFT_540164 [Xylogone sp. PMI_703]|nr:hypothetical protein F5884DRAFT_540164 [Xylogone sp. PMI_703]